jgi:membrane protein
MLFLLWLYVGWVIVLLGAQVSHAHQSIRFYYRDRDYLANTPAGREKIALETLLLIGARFYRGLNPCTVDEIAARLGIDASTVKEMMETFRNSKLVLALAGEEAFVLSRHPETIGIKEILDCVRKGRERRKSQRPVGKEESAVDELLMEMDRSIGATLEGRSLESLILDAAPARP